MTLTDKLFELIADDVTVMLFKDDHGCTVVELLCRINAKDFGQRECLDEVQLRWGAVTREEQVVLAIERMQRNIEHTRESLKT